ncbi:MULTISPECIES: biotin synthase BioB [unclassified Shewanella]|uniref:biotin synthase BioB n=1 Tax=unclassified Shewanella TaxID=196818 RepID=UPI000C863614|nr:MULTISPECIES: biotin synthase BioB [unclassified Shewanella]MDO6618207.1 biotin synthase BioB [Shewanella sp. 6_MG-2023]MDO6638483.1 biotin synthase BioB [Shewanella sp. 5_MG-2023]MDO6677348.1 biotin synthase BioB [Shewanella sp. 4_MG-2023]MDO6774303.1 biotin synthase BioB [Shewanella sp. 3_MG-2023]PMG42244.1 biotin synthase BioB [Shewanella sp. 10N.286.52.B9]
MSSLAIRHDWTKAEIEALFALPMNDLLFKAHSIHRETFDPNEVQISRLLSIKTGACPEDCKYCPQSARYDTGLEKERLLEIEKVITEAKSAKAAGASRFCMGAAWRNPRERDMPYLTQMVKDVRALGMETCMTLGMLSKEQSDELAKAGLDYYNHNLDTSPEYYGDVITTRTYQNRIDTLTNVRQSGMKVCSGGIVGMGEKATDRAGLLQQLANLEQHPDSVPINMLVKVAGTPFEKIDDLDPFEFVRTIAVARIIMPKSRVRLSAGRESMTDELQSMCFFAGANSIFYGCKLLTTPNPEENDDMSLFRRLGLHPEQGPSADIESDTALLAKANAKKDKATQQFFDAAAL